MANLSTIISEWQCLSRDALVEKLVEEKNIEELTSIKLELHDKCKDINDFPRGEFYSRRKPKGSSSLGSLEERLAELMNCFDTGIVTNEVKALFKSDVAKSVTDENSQVNRESSSGINNVNDASLMSPKITNRSLSGWSGLKNKLSSTESDQILFCERVLSEIMELKTKVAELDSTIQAQNAEIKQLKFENERLLRMQPSSNNSIACNEKSITTFQQRIDHVVQDKDLIMENEDINNTDITIQDGLNVPLSKETRSYRSALLSNYPKEIDEVSNYLLNNEESIQETNKVANLERNNTKSSSTVLQDDGFTGVQRNRVKTRRYYIGGIAETTKKETIIQYLNSKGYSQRNSKRKGLSAKMNVRAADVQTMIVADFWPKYVYCRPWVSKKKLEIRIGGEVPAGKEAEGTKKKHDGRLTYWTFYME